jgi:fumarylacetoacetase
MTEISLLKQTVKRAGAAIGDLVLDLASIEKRGIFYDCLHIDKEEYPVNHSPIMKGRIFDQESLNRFASLPADKRSAVRNKIITLLQDRNSLLFSDPNINSTSFWRLDDIQMYLPMQIGDFTDFMCSRTHADNVSIPANLLRLIMTMCSVLSHG